MNKLCLNPAYCKGCLICVEVCPKGAIASSEQINAQGYVLPKEKKMSACTGCKQCEIVCPDFAIAIAVDETRKEA